MYEVVQPEFEAGLEIVRQALLHLQVPATEIYHFTDEIRHELYAPLRDSSANYQSINKLKQAVTHLMELTWIDLQEQTHINGLSIGELQVRQQTGASIVGILRQGVVIRNPSADHQLQTGDVVAILGDRTQVEQVQRLLEEVPAQR